MKKEKNESGGDGQRGRVSASFVTGAIALVFLVLGYQTAVFVHRAAVAKIIATGTVRTRYMSLTAAWRNQ